MQRRPAGPFPSHGTPTESPVAVGGVELPVPRGELETRLPRDSIPADVEPEFAGDWAGLSVTDTSTYGGGPLLPNDAPVVGVERGDEARAYPLQILDWHEVVNDSFGGTPVSCSRHRTRTRCAGQMRPSITSRRSTRAPTAS